MKHKFASFTVLSIVFLTSYGLRITWLTAQFHKNCVFSKGIKDFRDLIPRKQVIKCGFVFEICGEKMKSKIAFMTSQE